MARRYPWDTIPMRVAVIFLALWSCHLVLPVTAKSGQVTEVRAVRGRQAVLPCPVAAPVGGDGGDGVTFILFSFVTPRGPARIYLVNNKGGKVTHWAARGYESRALVHWQGGGGGSSARLALDGIELEDSGLYWCLVHRSSSTATNSTIRLSVFAPPTSLKIYSDLKPDTAVTGVVGPYDLQEVVTFSCRVTEGHPRPNVTWWEGSRLLEDSHVTHTDLPRSTTTRSDITVGPLTRRDLHRNLTCRASNSDLYDALEAAVTLDLRYPPSSVRIVGERDGQLAVRAGVRREVVCEVRGGRPTPSIMLRLDQSLLVSRPGIEEEEEEAAQAGARSVTSTAELVPREEQDGSLVTCLAEGPPFQHIVTSVRLTVHYPPRVKVLFGHNLDPKYVEEGDDFNFQCHVTAKPSVTAVTWSLDGEALLNNPSQGVHADGLNLYLEGVSRSSSGEYRCAATNSEGEGVSDPLYLKVRGKPEAVTSCKVTSNNPQEGKAVILEVQCVAKADGDLSKIFLLEVKRVGRSKAEKRQHQLRPMFTIKGLKEGRYQLTVTASNDLGNSPPNTFNYIIHPPTSSSSTFSSITSSSYSSSSSSSISVSPSITSSSVSITALSSATATSAASSISPTPSLFSFSLSTTFSSPISPYATNSFAYKTPPPPPPSSSSSSFLPSPATASRSSSWRNPWVVFVLVIVVLTAITQVGCAIPQLLLTFFVVKFDRQPRQRQRHPSPRFAHRRNRNSKRELIRLSDARIQLPTITICPPASTPSTPLSLRKASLTLDYPEAYNFIDCRLAPHASLDSLDLSSLCPSLQDEQLDTYSIQDESVLNEKPQNGSLPRPPSQNGCVRNEPFLNNKLQEDFIHYNFIEKESLKRDLTKRPRSRPASPNFLSVDVPVRRSYLKEPSSKA